MEEQYEQYEPLVEEESNLKGIIPYFLFFIVGVFCFILWTDVKNLEQSRDFDRETIRLLQDSKWSEGNLGPTEWVEVELVDKHGELQKVFFLSKVKIDTVNNIRVKP